MSDLREVVRVLKSIDGRLAPRAVSLPAPDDPPVCPLMSVALSAQASCPEAGCAFWETWDTFDENGVEVGGWCMWRNLRFLKFLGEHGDVHE